MRIRRARKRPIVGLDLSLRNAACCMIPWAWNLDVERVRVVHFGTGLKSDATPAERVDRSIMISDAVLGFCDSVDAGAIYIEDHAFGAGGNNANQTIEMTGDVKAMLRRHLDLAPIPVASSRARKVLLQKLPRSDIKKFAQRNVKRLGGVVLGWTEDEIDAFVVANAGLMFEGGLAMTFMGER